MISFAKPSISKKTIKYSKEVLLSGWLGLGKYNLKLEGYFKKILKKKYAVCLSNGTIASYMAFKCIEFNNYDEIIVPSISYISPIHSITKLNKKIKIVPASMNENNIQLNLKNILSKITNKTKAILIIHNYGFTFELDELIKNLKKFNNKIIIVEDFSEAIFSKINSNTLAGQLGDISFSSLHATKTIAAGEGGIILTNNKKIYNFINQYSKHGAILNSAYSYSFPGNNFKLSNILASIAYSQMEESKNIIKKRYRNYIYYEKELSNIKNLKILEKRRKEKVVPWVYPIILKNKKIRDRLQRYLAKNKIQTKESFKSIYNQNYLSLKNIHNKNKIINLANSILMLPSHDFISLKNIQYIKNLIIKFFDQK